MWLGQNAQARWVFTSPFDSRGSSKGNYSNFNIATHVGDDAQSVQKNRARVGALLDVAPTAIVWPQLIHSSIALEVQDQNQLITPADIVHTSNPNIALATMAADCVPLVAIARDKPFILTAHIGWKGASLDITTVITELFRVQKTSDMDIILGPAICGKCYQVSDERLQQVVRVLPGAELNTGIDLRLGLRQHFEKCGYRVQTVGPCTFESDDLYSFRKNSSTGRQGAVVRLL